MAGIDAAFYAAGGATSLALAAALWALAQRRSATRQIRALTEALAMQSSEAAQASVEAFGSAVIAIDPYAEDGATAELAAGPDSLSACAEALGLDATAPAEKVVEALIRSDDEHARKLTGLIQRGEPCDFEARSIDGGSTVVVEGRTAGALAWLRLTVVEGASAGLPSAARFAAFLDALPSPTWITGADGWLVWANRSWLGAAGAASADEAEAGDLSFDRAIEQVAIDAAEAGEARRALRWAPLNGQRRAFQVLAEPLEGGGAGGIALDVTDSAEVREELRRNAAAHDETLNRLADAVAIFGRDRRLSFHNIAFAELWGLEPAWLAEGPTHGEILDRLRQRRRLPDTADYAGWKARELALYESLDVLPDELWSVPDGRTLRVVRQPHPLGGLLILFSNITGELRLRAQYNSQVQVQQATLDKLNDAVAVFGSDGRLRLHNEAFERFWNLSSDALKDAGDFDGVAALCTPLLHDRLFWRQVKARVADPDPVARAPVSGEIRTSDQRIVVYQTRPLPDGATLIGFDDVTATRKLEEAVIARSEALADAERLKRDFVGNVSYELRTPLTTIIGYSELLESLGDQLGERARGHVASVRSAAAQLARSIDDVLDMAQIDANEMALSLGDTDVAALLQHAESEGRRTAEQGGVRLEIADGAAGGVIRADGRRLAQALDHLVNNAIRSTPPGGRVLLDARRAQGEVRISVTDTGRGIPYHVQAHIFDRFVGRDRGGPGLGLALVKALVELHGGWVTLESEPGNGATFTCHVPESADVGQAHPELSFG
jgi:signal transduction histidine kinase